MLDAPTVSGPWSVTRQLTLERERRQRQRHAVGVQIPTIIELMESPEWFGDWFRGDTWEGWKAFLAGVFGLAMTPAQLAIWQECTRRAAAPTSAASEAWLVVGRRGGKSRIVSLIAVYLACFRNYLEHLAPGEWATIPVISADRKESRTVMRYVKAFLEHPRLQTKIVKLLTESVELANRVQIEVHVARFKAVRSYTVVAAICDEMAFWETAEDSANPDSEVLTALRPAMGTVPGSLLLGLSSPYARLGVLWEIYSDHFGKDDPEVVWQAPTLTMNPRFDRQIIAKAYEKDPDAAGAEYGGQFRTDIEKFISEESIRAAVVDGRERLPRISDVQYLAFVDPSGGTIDSMTLGIAHTEGNAAVLDCLLEVVPPFSPSAVVEEFAKALAEYGVTHVVGDRYGGEWPRERFRENGIFYYIAEQPKSEIYLTFLAAMNSGQVRLLDHPRTLAQLRGLERRHGRGGRDIVDHPPKAHDDCINSAAGAVCLAVPTGPTVRVLDTDEEESAMGQSSQSAPRDPLARLSAADRAQVESVLPLRILEQPGDERCGSCIWREAKTGLPAGKTWCQFRLVQIRDVDLACEHFDLAEQ